MANYYVSAGEGNNGYDGTSPSHAGGKKGPKATIQAGVDLLSAGDRLFIRRGTYHERVVVNRSGTASNPITIQNYENERPILDGRYELPGGEFIRTDPVTGNGFVYNALLQIEGNHIVISGLEITRSRGRGVEALGKSNSNRRTGITVRNCTIHDTRCNAVQFNRVKDTLLESVEIFHATNFAQYPRSPRELDWAVACLMLRADNATVRKCTIHNNWAEGLSFGRETVNSLAEDNIIYDNMSVSLYVNGARNVTLQRNLVYCTGDESWMTGPGAGANDAGYRGTGIVVNFEDFQFESGDQYGATDVEVLNNFVVGCSQNLALWGAREKKYKDILFAGNTAVNARPKRKSGSDSKDAVNLRAHGTEGDSNIQFLNNIVYQDGGFAEADVSGYAGHTYDYNCYRARPGNGYKGGKNDIYGDPRLKNPNAPTKPGQVSVDNYKLASTNSPCVDAGLSLRDLKEDYWRGARNGRPDIGAHEYGSNGTGPTPPPIRADFAIGQGGKRGTVPHEVTFDASSSEPQGDIVSYTWDFGDGTRSTVENAVHTHIYEQQGTYSVTLTVKDGRDRIDSTTQTDLIVVEGKAPRAAKGRVTRDLQVLYQFKEGSGAVVRDRSSVGDPLDLRIKDTAATRWLDKGLSLEKPTFVQSTTAATKVSEACRKTGEITLEAWVKPGNVYQDGPARIVTLSTDTQNRNFTLGQGGRPNSSPSDFYDVRLRTKETDNNGAPSLSTKPGTLSAALTHVVYTRDKRGVARIYLNDQKVAEMNVPGDMSGWETGYPLILGNERTGARPWVGELHLVAVYSRALTASEVHQNYEAGAHPGDAAVNAAFNINKGEETGIVPHTVHFDAAASSAAAGIKRYTWDFGDGQQGDGVQVTHVYERAGTYTVALTVEDNNGAQDTHAIVDYIVVQPLAQDRVMAGLQVLYTFLEGKGTTVSDVSGVGKPLDLTIKKAEAVKWLAAGLSINNPVTVSSEGPATKVIDACRQSDEISVEVWIKPANVKQDGPARLVTVSKDLQNRNVTLAEGLWNNQPSDLFDARLRTKGGDQSDNGMPSLSTPAGSATTALTHVVFTRDKSGQARIYVNGEARTNKRIAGNLDNWDPGYGLHLANEAVGQRPWLGDLYLVAVYSRALSASEVRQNFEAGTPVRRVELPPSAVPSTFRRFTLIKPGGQNGEALVAYGAQYPDRQCVLLWDGKSEFETFASIDAVTEKHADAQLSWID